MATDKYGEVVLDEQTLRDFGDEPVPQWVHALMRRVAQDALPDRIDALPAIVMVPVREGQKFGGRHYPELNAIAVYKSADRLVVKTVVIHEMIHWILAQIGDPSGEHDKKFYEWASALYPMYEIPTKTARFVEQVCDDPNEPCHTWSKSSYR